MTRDQDIVELTMREAGSLLARRELSVAELVEATLRRIEQTEPVVHAYALVLAEQAHAAARAADAEISAGQYRGPLHGIPIGVKDLCYTRGVPTEAGSRALAGFVPEYDAAVVERLRAAGAIIIGKTVTHEFAYGVNVPPTRTPWLADGYPGGSSAGSGAAVATRSAFGAIGTDTGGSIREPASLNGLVGLKPTFGLVSRYGVVPLSPSLDAVGPLARTVEDCALLLAGIAGYDPRDAGSIDAPVPDILGGLEVGASGLTIGVERGYYFGELVSGEVRTAVDGVLAELSAQGARIVEVEIPDLDLMSVVGMTLVLTDASAYHGGLLRERGADLDPATRVMFELGHLVPGPHYVTALRARRRIRDRLREVFTAHALDVLISPTTPTPTMTVDVVWRENEQGEDPTTAAINFTLPASLAGMPALSAPCGFTADGLPIGYQILGRPFDEATVFRLARAYERNHDWASVTPALAG